MKLLNWFQLPVTDIDRAVTDGMVTLRDDGWRRVLQGMTTVEEVVRVTQMDEAISETA